MCCSAVSAVPSRLSHLPGDGPPSGVCSLQPDHLVRLETESTRFFVCCCYAPDLRSAVCISAWWAARKEGLSRCSGRATEADSLQQSFNADTKHNVLLREIALAVKP
jgi:hypothetical protein